MLRSTKASAHFYFLFLKIEYKLWEALFAHTMPDHMCEPLKGRSSPAILMRPKIKNVNANGTVSPDMFQLSFVSLILFSSTIIQDNNLNNIFFSSQTATATAKSLQSCLTLCDPIDGSPPGSSVPGILQARTLE